MLRKQGYEVRQIHHAMSFTSEELTQIIDNFSKGDPIVACISTSFLGSLNRKNRYFIKGSEYDPEICDTGFYWGGQTFRFLLTLGNILKQKQIPTLMGGWKVVEKTFAWPGMSNAWGWDVLANFVNYFIIGSSIDPIVRFCNSEELENKTYGKAKVVYGPEVTDFTDCASTPLPEDCINQNEALITEVAAGCIFSCSFCDYKVLGKKKNEYVRTYDSLKREIVSNYDNFKTRFYILTDNIINDFDEKLHYLIRIREETGIDLRWSAYGRLDTMAKKDSIQLLVDSGCAGLVFGIESMKKEVGQYIGKMTDKNKLIDRMKLFRDVVGDTILVNGSFIAGLPTETKDDLYKTYEWLQSDEGRYYIDSYTFTSLFIHDHNDEKNEINKARNNPFRDYVKVSQSRWISPWGTFEEFSDLAHQFNLKRTNYISGFLIQDMHNLGVEVEDVVSIIRKNNDGIKKHILEPVYSRTKQKIDEYKKKVLAL